MAGGGASVCCGGPWSSETNRIQGQRWCWRPNKLETPCELPRVLSQQQSIGSLLRAVQGKMGSNLEEPGGNPGQRFTCFTCAYEDAGLDGEKPGEVLHGGARDTTGRLVVQTGSITALASWI